MSGVEPGEGGFVVDAELLAEAFGLDPEAVRGLMRSGGISSRCEKGVEADAGRWRLVFSHGGRTLRLTVDETGAILGRTRIDVPRAC